jgi:hypothetical protein
MNHAFAGDTGILPDEGVTTAASAVRLEKMAAKARAAGMEAMAALLDVAHHGIIICNHPRSAVPIDLPESGHGRGAVVILLDDEGKAEGPDSFDQESLRRVARGCASWAVISAAPPPDLYRQAGLLAAGGWPIVVLVETYPSHEQAWVDFFQRNAPWYASQTICTPSAGAFRAGREAAGKPRH